MITVPFIRRVGKIGLPALGTAMLILGLSNSVAQAQLLHSTAKAPPTTRFQVNTRLLQLPLYLDRNQVAKLKEVCLYVKEGAGDWKCLARVAPNASSITCELPRDGEYSLILVTIDHMGKNAPADLNKVAPTMVVVVDTRQTRPAPLANGNPFSRESPLPDLTSSTSPTIVNTVFQDTGTPPTATSPAGETQAIRTVSGQTALPAMRESLPPAAEAPAMAIGNLPKPKYFNSPRVGLDYSIKKVGPSGVSKIDVYITSEQGGNWKKLTTIEDPNNHSDVELPGEGVFGIRLVATNGNGFGGKVPGPADLPTAIFEIDMTGPNLKVDIDPVTKLGTIDIRWQVSDKNLSAEPIQILYAAQPTGPWQIAGTKLKNDGLFRWNLPRDIPQNFVIRIEARDLAGNMTHLDTPNPVSLDLTEPDVALIGLSPATVPTTKIGSGR
jgi:hypothetical protein